MRKIEVPTDTPSEFELRVTAADIQRREVREAREKEEEAQNSGRKPRGRKLHTQQSREWPKSIQGQTEVINKWTHTVEVRWTCLNCNPQLQNTRSGT